MLTLFQYDLCLTADDLSAGWYFSLLLCVLVLIPCRDVCVVVVCILPTLVLSMDIVELYSIVNSSIFH